MTSLRASLPELAELEALLPELPGARTRTLTVVRHAGQALPVHAVLLGPADVTSPALLFVGGVHGLERVGTQVLLAYLRSLRAALGWDELLGHMLRRIRLLFVPLVNPAGMALGLRSNARGVDLMRNSPVRADADSRWYELHRGQRLSPYLPWYQGDPERGMESESRALAELVEEQLFPSACAVVVDVHSSFLAGDRLWFPYARSRAPIAHAPELLALAELLGRTHEGHVYTFEPQAINYTTHGDLWDHLYDRSRAGGRSGVFLPLTLELSSHPWYRKNPRQLVHKLGLFHPIKPHRLARVQRRHKTLFDFLARAVLSHERWLPCSPEQRAQLERRAHERWFGSERGGPR